MHCFMSNAQVGMVSLPNWVTLFLTGFLIAAGVVRMITIAMVSPDPFRKKLAMKQGYAAKIALIFSVLLLLFFSNSYAESDQQQSLFRDQEDGQFDISNWLGTRQGFLPTPMIITGPTFGAGGGVNLMFLHNNMSGTISADDHYIPPNLSGLVVAATENGTKFGGAYHLGFWKEGRVRTTSFIGYPDVNLDFYPKIAGREGHVTMNLKGPAFYQEVKVRLGHSNFFLGGNYTYVKMDSSPEGDERHILDELLTRQFKVGGLAAILEYDSRNAIFTATEGMYAKFVAEKQAEWLGGNFDSMMYRAKIFKFIPLSDRFNLGVRFEGESVDTSSPYFRYPSVELRGIPNKRYQGQHMMLGELELNWKVYKRWHLIGFAGSGKAFGENKLKKKEDFTDADWRSSGGVGFRYEIARKFGLQLGADVAVGPEETAFYVTVGSAWDAFY